MRITTRVHLLAVFGLLTLAPLPALAGTDTAYYQAKVVAVSQGTLNLRMLTGPDAGHLEQATSTAINSYVDITLPTYHVGDTVVAYRSPDPGSSATYAVVDEYRLPNLFLWMGIVAVLALIFAGWRGLGALAGLAISVAIIGGFVIPQVLAGHNVLLTALAGAGIIAALAIYLAHGFSKRTTLALISTYITLLISVALSTTAVHMAGLSGLASEDISYLHQQLPALDIQGALLAGILIGMLGVMDDVTVGQAATVQELIHTDKKLRWPELYRRALKVGREHISSLINTLVLAYLGTSFLFVLFVVATSNQPLWVTLNSELVMEEVVRSLVGGVALILAVPISTFLSAYFLTKKPIRVKKFAKT